MRSLIPCVLVALFAVVGSSPAAELPSLGHVEMTGTLKGVWTRKPYPVSFYLDVNGTSYRLALETRPLRRLAEQLEDHVVVVTGQLHGQTVDVESLRDTTNSLPTPVRKVKIKGKLAENMDLGNLGSGPARFTWEITVDGQRYELDLSSDPRLLEMAKTFRGQTVVITGEVDDLFFLEELDRPLPAKWKPRPWLAMSSPIRVIGMAIEPGDDQYYVDHPGK